MRIMGLDLGTVTCGVAVSDPTEFLASPVKTVRFESENYEQALDLLLPLIDEYKPGKLVLGLPRHMNGDVGVRGQASVAFKEMLEKETGLEVILEDERLTTVMATRDLLFQDVSRKKRKKVVDQMAAVQILQGYLDKNKRG